MSEADDLVTMIRADIATVAMGDDDAAGTPNMRAAQSVKPGSPTTAQLRKPLPARPNSAEAGDSGWMPRATAGTASLGRISR